MRNPTRRDFINISGALVVSSALMPSGLARAETPKAGGVLTIGQDANPVGLDPHKTAAFSTGNIVEHVYTCLLRWDETASKVQPDLATSWENPDPKTFIFHLRKDVLFHDGQPFTSSDVKFTFERLVDPATASPWKSIFSVIASIDTPDPNTVVFHLKDAFSPLLNYLATVKYSAIVSEADVRKRGDLVNGGVGTGPFMFESYQPDSVVRLKRNPHYYESGLPYLDGLDFRIIPDEGSRMAALRSGSVQLTWMSSPDSAAQMRGVPDVTAPDPSGFWRLLLVQFDQAKPPFSDVRVRRAFSLAVNREQIVKLVWRGKAGMTASLPPAQMPYAVPSDDVANLPYMKEDLEQAKKLLADAGYPNGFETEFAVSPSNYGDVPVVQIIQQQVGRIGIKISIQQMEWGNLVNAFQTTGSPISMAGLVWGPDPDTNITIRLDSHSPVNPGKTADPDLDKLLADGRSTYDIDAREKIYRAVQERVADQAFVVTPCATPMRWEMWRSQLQGYRPYPSAQRVALREAWMS